MPLKLYFAFLFLRLILSPAVGLAQQLTSPSRIAPTYSIIAHDPESGELAVASLAFSSSNHKTFIWSDTPIGVVTLHSPVSHSFQVWDIQLLKNARQAADLVHQLTAKDAYRDYYQVACLDTTGRFIFFKGKNSHSLTYSGAGKSYVIVSSLAPDSSTTKMAQAFEETAGKSIAERVLTSLKAGLPEKAPLPEKQSASLLVLAKSAYGWGRLFDLHVANQPYALLELDTQVRRKLSYLYFQKGDLAAAKGNTQKALQEYRKAAGLFPQDTETQYWYGITLADHQLMDEACAVLSEVFRKDSKWRQRTARLPEDGLLHISKKDLDRILTLQ